MTPLFPWRRKHFTIWIFPKKAEEVFFQLLGRISWETDIVEVELKRCNDRALNRDLETLCAKVVQEQLRLPDGRRLLFRIQGTALLLLDAQEKAVA